MFNCHQYRVASHVPPLSDVEEHYFGPFTDKCPHCHALHWLAEKQAKSSKKHPDFAECCRAGIDFLDPIPQVPHLRPSRKGQSEGPSLGC